MNAKWLLQFLNDPAWDAPFFKRMAPNDTANAPGHQGGVVIPKVLRRYFPELDEEQASAISPTVDRHLIAELFIPGKQVGSDIVRYQFQTWNDKRKAESRITDNLGPLRKLAHGGDLFIMQRSRDSLDIYRFLLVQQTDVAFAEFDKLTNGIKWGPLFADSTPISQEELNNARKEMLTEAEQPFMAIRKIVPRISTTRSAIVRGTAFREAVLWQYQRRCAVSGIALSTQTAVEAQAAHVIALGRGGADEPRNGIALTGTLHWAFDNFLFSIGETRRVIVPDRVKAMPANAWLMQFHDKPILEARTPTLRTAPEAFAWHRENLCAQR